jgi:hypothetical protein
MVDANSVASYLERVIAVARTDLEFDAFLDFHMCGKGDPQPRPVQYLAIIRNLREVFAVNPQFREEFCRELEAG